MPMVTYRKKFFDSSPILSSIISQRFLVGEQWLIPFIPGSFHASAQSVNSIPESSGFMHCVSSKLHSPPFAGRRQSIGGTAAAEPLLSVPVSWVDSLEPDSSVEGASGIWMANRAYAYIPAKLGREKINVTLQFKHLLGTAGKWDTKESQGLFFSLLGSFRD